MVYHCFTGIGIWANLDKAGITKITYDFRRDRTTAQLCSYMRPLDDVMPQQWHDITPQLRLSAKRLEIDGWMVELM